MKKSILTLFLISMLLLPALRTSADSDNEEWGKYVDVYTDKGLDRPVSALEYQKTMGELDKLKKRSQRKPKKGEIPEPFVKNEPVKVDTTNVIKVTNTLYYDGTTIPMGFYKIAPLKENDEYFIVMMQGKACIAKIKANKLFPSQLCKDKVNCLETEVYQEKYFKIKFKNLEYALSGYLAIVD